MYQKSSNFICCQIGAREHYAIPRALDKINQLNCLITDSWISRQSIINKLPESILKNLRERYHPDLNQAQIFSFTRSLITFELQQQCLKNQKWNKIIARNNWFQQQTIKKLSKLVPQFHKTSPILFCYSYAAIDLLRFAKRQGWKTVLGQIDPGILEEKIVSQEYNKYSHYQSSWEPAPPAYWQAWQEECDLADVIVVNSDWSRHLLEKIGVEPNKLKILPLVYTPPESAKNFRRSYPLLFSETRPLNVLFLGQIILRKGIAYVLEAIKLLEGYPVVFWFVGSNQVEFSHYFQCHSQIRWIGQISRSDTARYYKLADVFLFPTLSDGFGLTQLEAQSWHLPIIASRNCGKVVDDGVNGYLLSDVNGEAIANIIKKCLETPANLEKLSQASRLSQEFSLSNLANQLTNIF